MVRPLSEEDVPQVAELHRKVFGTGDRTSPELLASYRTYLVEILLNNPWWVEGIRPLVYQEEDGRIIGFLGVMPRLMSINGRTIQAAVASNLCVEPRSPGLVALKLLKALLSGPQDLVFADECNDAARTICEKLGGTTSLLYSIRWTRPLRPFQLGLCFSPARAYLLPLATFFNPMAKIADALAARVPQTPFHQCELQVRGEDLDCETLLTCLNEFPGEELLRPQYDRRSLQWLLERVDRMEQHGRLKKVLVKTEKGEIAGWYLYYLKSAGVSEVLQMAARNGWAHQVFGHLSYHAWRHGALGLSGKLPPGFLPALSDKYCLLQRGCQWMVIHARGPELLEAFWRGKALIPRLEGEWCQHFR